MIVNGGKLAYLTNNLSNLATYYLQLFTNNFSIVDGTVIGSLTLASWTGYASVAIGTMGSAAIVGVQAVSAANTAATFTNTSGSSQTYYGWAVTSGSSGGTLYEATNVGLQTLLTGASISLPYSLAFQDISD